jgi:hypothetical protein
MTELIRGSLNNTEKGRYSHNSKAYEPANASHSHANNNFKGSKVKDVEVSLGPRMGNSIPLNLKGIKKANPKGIHNDHNPEQMDFNGRDDESNDDRDEKLSVCVGGMPTDKVSGNSNGNQQKNEAEESSESSGAAFQSPENQNYSPVAGQFLEEENAEVAAAEAAGVETISIDELFNPKGEPVIDPKEVILPNFEPARTSSRQNGVIAAYAANTNTGVFRYRKYF